MKKLINDVNNVEEEMILGLVKSAPQKLAKLDDYTVVVRKDKKQGKVALVSGGGSGHEPAHAGYVGIGMLCSCSWDGLHVACTGCDFRRHESRSYRRRRALPRQELPRRCHEF